MCLVCVNVPKIDPKKRKIDDSLAISTTADVVFVFVIFQCLICCCSIFFVNSLFFSPNIIHRWIINNRINQCSCVWILRRKKYCHYWTAAAATVSNHLSIKMFHFSSLFSFSLLFPIFSPENLIFLFPEYIFLHTLDQWMDGWMDKNNEWKKPKNISSE